MMKSRQEEIHELNKVATDSENDDVDFSKKIHPIGYFINDREQMIEEMFSIIHGKKLQDMLPAILKDCSVEELKADCLVHLLGMSRKRIFAILDGRTLNSSSNSETDDDDSVHSIGDSQYRSDSSLKLNPDKGIIVSSKKKGKNTAKERISGRRKAVETLDIPSIVISDDETVIKKEKKSKDPKKKKKSGNKDFHESTSKSGDEDGESKGKSLLELLELEMRARAIRALLKSTVNPDEPVPVSVVDMQPNPNTKLVPEINETIDQIINSEDVTAANIDLNDYDIEIHEVAPDTVVIVDDDEEFVTGEKTKLTTEKIIEDPRIGKAEMYDKITEANVDNPVPDVCLDETDIVFLSGDECDAVENDIPWSKRWIESKKVKDVIKSSKLCASIKKRMRFARLLKQKQMIENEKVKKHVENEKLKAKKDLLLKLDNVEESSVEQYNLIKSLDKTQDTNQHSSVMASVSSEVETKCLVSDKEKIDIENHKRTSSIGENLIGIETDMPLKKTVREVKSGEILMDDS